MIIMSVLFRRYSSHIFSVFPPISFFDWFSSSARHLLTNVGVIYLIQHAFSHLNEGNLMPETHVPCLTLALLAP